MTNPLLYVVDDAQWLDQVSVQTLAFVARLMAEPVAFPVPSVSDPTAGAYRSSPTGGRRGVVCTRGGATRHSSRCIGAGRSRWSDQVRFAHALSPPVGAVAAELETSAGRAQSRGGVAAAAAFLERATVLTSDPARRGSMALAAAQAKRDAAAPEAAYELLAIAELCPVRPSAGPSRPAPCPDGVCPQPRR